MVFKGLVVQHVIVLHNGNRGVAFSAIEINSIVNNPVHGPRRASR
jgi:hypothetical protein